MSESRREATLAGYTADQLLRILRARTFPPHRGAFFRYEGKKVYVRVEFEEEGDGEQHKH